MEQLSHSGTSFKVIAYPYCTIFASLAGTHERVGVQNLRVSLKLSSIAK